MSSLTPEEIAYYKAHANDDLRPNEIAANVCGYAFALLAVILRVIARRILRTKFWVDDYLILVAMVPLTVYTILMALSTANGEGRHIIFVKNPKLFVQEYVAAIIFYSLAVIFTKFSILSFYRRIFDIEFNHLISHIIAVIVVLYSLALIFVTAFQCIPLSSMWTGEPGKCINTTHAYMGLAIVNVLTDFAILALPIKPVLGLHMRKNQKIQVLGIFLLGGIVCVFGIIRTVAITTMKSTDPSWTAVMAGIWSYTEISVGVVAACLPTLRPIFKRLRTSSDSHTIDPSGSGNRFFSLRSNGVESTKCEYQYQFKDNVALTDCSYQNRNWTSSEHARSFENEGGIIEQTSPAVYREVQPK